MKVRRRTGSRKSWKQKKIVSKSKQLCKRLTGLITISQRRTRLMWGCTSVSPITLSFWLKMNRSLIGRLTQKLYVWNRSLVKMRVNMTVCWKVQKCAMLVLSLLSRTQTVPRLLTVSCASILIRTVKLLVNQCTSVLKLTRRGSRSLSKHLNMLNL